MFSILQPLSIGIFVPVLSRMKRARLIFNLQDLHPDALVDLGLITNKAVVRVLRSIESFSYRSADRVTVICDRFKNHVVSKGVRPNKVEVIENWVNLDEIAPGNRINDFRTRVGLSDADYVVLYAGTIGFVSGVEIVLEAADKLRGQTDIKFLFVGDGPLVGKLKRRSEELSLDNTIFAPFQDKNILNDVQATADVSLVTMRKGKGNFSVPSKVLSYMAAARPVIASVDAETETAKQIRTAECGIVVPAGDSDAIADAILDLHTSDELRARLGMNGRKYLEENLNRNTVLEKYRKLFEDIGGA